MWKSDAKVAMLHAQYRGTVLGAKFKNFSVHFDILGNDHYQDSQNNRHRRIRRQPNGIWQFETKGRFEDYNASVNTRIENAYAQVMTPKQTGKRKAESRMLNAVFALPCGRGFPKENLVKDLENMNVKVVSFFCDKSDRSFGKDPVQTTWDQLNAVVLNHMKLYNHILFHGWSRGGKHALEIASMRPANLKGIATFAAAGTPLHIKNIVCPTILYHNRNDTVINVSVSEQNHSIISSSELELSNRNFGGNNHQCDEFVSHCVSWLHSHLLVTTSIPQKTIRPAVPQWWSTLHDKIRKSDKYCYIRSQSAGPSIIDAFASNEIYVNKNPNLDPALIKFENDKYDTFDADYNFFQSPSGNMLLVPPLDIGATNIKDFARRNSIDEWNILYNQILKRWEPGIWVCTEGHAVHYLHIRFEKTPLYNPASDHIKL